MNVSESHPEKPKRVIEVPFMGQVVTTHSRPLTQWPYIALWTKMKKNTDKIAIHFPRNEGVSKVSEVSEQASEWASKVSGPEQANKWGVRANGWASGTVLTSYIWALGWSGPQCIVTTHSRLLIGISKQNEQLYGWLKWHKQERWQFQWKGEHKNWSDGKDGCWQRVHRNFSGKYFELLHRWQYLYNFHELRT